MPVQPIPELPAPTTKEPPGPHENAMDEQQQRRGPDPDAGGPQSPAQPSEERRSWWREFFGFD